MFFYKNIFNIYDILELKKYGCQNKIKKYVETVFSQSIVIFKLVKDQMLQTSHLNYIMNNDVL